MSDRTRLVIEGILDGDGFHQTNGASFREWLNAHDAQIRAEAKAEALREAADDLARLANITSATSAWMTVDSLRARADNLEQP